MSEIVLEEKFHLKKKKKNLIQMKSQTPESA